MTMDSDVLLAAVRTYFHGERQEMLIILAAVTAITLSAGLLYLSSRDGFAMGLGITVSLAALLLASTAISLLRRDSPLRMKVETAVSVNDAGAISAEAGRVVTIEGRYVYYRYFALVLGAIAMVAVAFVRRDCVVGTSAGLLLLVVAQLTIDHYSERRANRYSATLRAWLSCR